MESMPKILENVANKIKTLLDTYIVTSSATDAQKQTYLTSANNSVTNIITFSTYISNIKDASEKAKNATILGQSVAQSIAETGIIGEQSIVNNLLANVDDANDSFSYISNIQTNINTINSYITVKYQDAVTVFDTPTETTATETTAAETTSVETTSVETTTSSLLANGSLCTSSSQCKSNFCYLTNNGAKQCNRGNLCATSNSGTKLYCSRIGLGSTINTGMSDSSSCVGNTCPAYRTGTNSGL
jgi:transcriptional regulator with PAS, ATPase and Fis domain